MRVGCSYLRPCFDARRDLVKAAKRHIPEDVDGVVGTGLSGALVIGAIAEKLDVHMAIARKPGEKNHSWHELEGYLPDRGKWAFVDDFIEGGDTLLRVRGEVEMAVERYSLELEFAGAYLYSGIVSSTSDPVWVPADQFTQAGRIRAPFKRKLRPATMEESLSDLY